MLDYWLRTAPGAFGLIGGWYLALMIWPQKFAAAIPWFGALMLIEECLLLFHGICLSLLPFPFAADTAVEDPERFKLWRWVKSLNIARPWLRGIEKTGEVPQQGIGKTWLERSMFFATQTRQVVRDAVMDAWTKLIQSRQPGGQDMPPKDRGPEMSR